MAYFADTMPRPDPNMDDREFWQACGQKRLEFQGCADCHTARHPPTPICAVCRSSRVEWRAAPPEAEIYTYTVIHHAAHPAVASRLPYVAAVVTFDDIKGVRLVTNITDCEPARVKIGMRVTLWWDDLGNGAYLPRFSPVTGS